MLLDVRAEVTKALEAARAAKQIAASLEAAVVLRGPAETLAALRAHDARSTVFPGNLANLFIVSEVRLEEADGPLEVKVEHAAGASASAAGPGRRASARCPRTPACASGATRS